MDHLDEVRKALKLIYRSREHHVICHGLIAICERLDRLLETKAEPICPDCGETMVKAYEQNEDGEWGVRWLCGCRPSPEKIAQLTTVP